MTLRMRFAKILCPIDFSAGSREAMTAAAELASESAGEVVLLHVWHPPYITSPEAPIPEAMMIQLRSDAEHELAKWRDEVVKHAPRVTAKLAIGAPWDQIVALAKDDPAIDLVVIGTHGRTGIKRALLGSVAEKVVRHATCPVLVVRSRD